MSTELTIKGDVEVLRLQPEDKILVTFDGPALSAALCEQVVAQVKDRFPGHEVVLANGLRLSILRDEDAA